MPVGTPTMTDRCFCTGSSVVEVGGISEGAEVGEGAGQNQEREPRRHTHVHTALSHFPLPTVRERV